MTSAQSDSKIQFDDMPPCIQEAEAAKQKVEKEEKLQALQEHLDSVNPDLKEMNAIYVKYKSFDDPLTRMEYVKTLSKENIASIRESYLRQWISINSALSQHVQLLNIALYEEDSCNNTKDLEKE